MIKLVEIKETFAQVVSNPYKSLQHLHVIIREPLN